MRANSQVVHMPLDSHSPAKNVAEPGCRSTRHTPAMVCLACPRVWNEKRSMHSPLSVPKKDGVDCISITVPRTAHAHADADIGKQELRLHHWYTAIHDRNETVSQLMGPDPAAPSEKPAQSVLCFGSQPWPIRSPDASTDPAPPPGTATLRTSRSP